MICRVMLPLTPMPPAAYLRYAAYDAVYITVSLRLLYTEYAMPRRALRMHIATPPAALRFSP